MASILNKLLIAVLLFNLLIASCSSFAAPPTVEPPSYVELPRLCNYDEFFRYGQGIFDDIESCNAGLLRRCNVRQIYQLGDSISDVGNLIRENNNTTPFANLPYGESFPDGPTGRASNGKLIIDYLAMEAGLPLLPPFKQCGADFSHGVNFAVAGSTALPSNALADLNISSSKTNNSLSVQLDWMSAYFHSLCNNQTDCGGKLQNSLFILGPFGGSDYYNALFQGKSMQEIRSKLLPRVVDAVMAAVRRVVSLGAKRVVVPGLYSVYQLPIFQMTFSDKPDMYEWSDDLAIYHNVQLEQAIDKFNQEESPNAIVAFADYYTAYRSIAYYSVGVIESIQACCGSGDEYFNLNLSKMCGAEGVSACAEPDRYISWDGMHLTQEAYRIMAKYVMYHMFFDLRCPNNL
ncbi:acetylajmalan esterase-like [Salvia miltiorrhiza]|uniref:acetylajmalan esterase-like n=1 Tax=Salvia miltiorrhiza TaxID=226208 RepID=UPI0025ABDD38|nr:acetylajmalan esterase-like [Salvia miltiorrhiza]